MKTATPAHGMASGSQTTPSRSVRTRSQSSSRPIMIVITGPMSSTRRPSASRAAEPALDGLTGGDGLGDREADRAVHVDAAVGGLLHDPDADRRGRELDDDVRGQRGEVDTLVEHPIGRPPEGRVRLHRESPLAATVAHEGRLEQLVPRSGTSPRRPPRRGRSRSRSAVRLGDLAHAARQCAGSFRQTSWTMVGLAVAPTAPKRDGVLELVDGARVVPDVGRRRGDRPGEGRGGQRLGHGVPPKRLITA